MKILLKILKWFFILWLSAVAILLVGNVILNFIEGPDDKTTTQEEVKTEIQPEEIPKKEVIVEEPGLFDNPEQIVSLLSRTEIGSLSAWEKKSYGWASLSKYYDFGNPKNEYGLKNNLAIYVRGESENDLSEIKLVLNINNAKEAKTAKKKLADVSKLIMEKLEIPVDKSILIALKKGAAKEIKHSDYSLIVEEEKSKIETWKFIIRVISN